MALKLSSLRADIDRERNGDWITPPPIDGVDLEGVSFKVRGINYPAFTAKRDREVKRLATRYSGEDIPQEEFDRVQGKLLAEEILLDWRGFDVPYAAHTALEILTDPAYRDVRTAVVACAMMITRTKAEFVEGAAKNSAPPSGKN